METYMLVLKKNTRNQNCSVRRIKQSRLMLVSNCGFCWKKTLMSISNQETSRLGLE